MTKKVLIVGGVAGGASAAARLRRLDEHANIIMIERDDHISFANCGLPYYIGETIQDREKLIVQTPDAMQARFALDIRVKSEVTAIQPQQKTVTIVNRERGAYQESYDVLLLAPGAKPLRPDIPGIENERIFTLRNIPDTDRIKEFVDRSASKRAVIIGGGFIGVEMAESLRERGLEVALAEAAPHILAPFDSEMAALVEAELRENGIKLHLNDGVSSFESANEEITIRLQSGSALSCDLVILAIGVTPDTAFLKESGLQFGSRGHIIVNEHMQTNLPNIYAVGDSIEVRDFINGQPTALPLAGPANKQGRIAADNIAGIASRYKGTQGTAILKAFSLSAAATGSNERLLKRLAQPYHTILVHPNSHASYYPDALPLTIKLLFNDTGRILGAQAVGPVGIDKHIDILATAIRLNGTIYDLSELELAYAPPFSSAKAPVNMAGFVAENILAKRFEVFTADQLASYDPAETILLDVRSEIEFSTGSLPGAINIPTDTLRSRLHELDKDKLILVYCKVGLQSYIASRILTQNGFRAKSLTGGYKAASALYDKNVDLPAVKPQGEAAPSSITPDVMPDVKLDAAGLSCPGPLMKVKEAVDALQTGQILHVTASDPGFFTDIKAWCQRTGNQLLAVKKENNRVIARLQKGAAPQDKGIAESQPVANKDNKTIVVFSGDLDKALASFVIANGAATLGKKVTMFFTFWGLNVLRKQEAVPVQKGLIDKMFGWMMPRGSTNLKLSNMHMLGMGTKMMRMVMKDKNIASLEDLIAAAQKANIEIVACQMSMDVMGLKKEELLDGVKIGGVGYYLNEAEDSNVNLFI